VENMRVRFDCYTRLLALATAAALAPLALTIVGTRGKVVVATSSGYRSLAKRTLGGDGFWDYLTMDPVARRLYISRWTHVMAVDADSYQAVGDIPDIAGAHGIAIAREFGRGFITEGEGNQVAIFDLRTLKKIGSAKTGHGPDGIIYDPASKRVFAFNGEDGTASVIEASTGAVVGTVALGGSPEFATADGEGHVYNNLEDKNEVLEIDSKTLKVLNRWPLAPGESPSAMAIDRGHHRLFIGCHNRLMVVMDADRGRVVATPAIGQGVDAARFDPSTQLVFSSNGEGSLTVVHEDSPDQYTVVDNVKTERGARTMELDPKTHRVYTVTADLGPQPSEPHQPPTMMPGSFRLLVFGQ
jgi:DNA-binding beta-propeller fold protein YncE